MFTARYVIAVVLAIIGSVEQRQLDDQICAAQRISVGDSEERVLKLLGPSRARWDHWLYIFGVGTGPPQWIYGTDVDLGSIIDTEGDVPNLFPFKIRLFCACDGDLVIG